MKVVNSLCCDLSETILKQFFLKSNISKIFTVKELKPSHVGSIRETDQEFLRDQRYIKILKDVRTDCWVEKVIKCTNAF
jgi:hypothetical protein